MNTRSPVTSHTRSLEDSVQFIKGVGPKRAVLLERLGLRVVRDCLFFLPFRYEDRSQIKTISQLVHGEQATFVGEIVNVGAFRGGRRRKILELVIQDETGVIRARWFQFNDAYMRNKFKTGAKIIASGKPVVGGSGMEIVHPNIENFYGDADPGLEVGRIVPIYRATEGLHLKSLRAIMKNVVDLYADMLEEFLPEEILRRGGLVPLPDAIKQLHFPSKDMDADPLQNFRSPGHWRVIFDELFLLQLGLAYKRKHEDHKTTDHVFKTRGELIQRFVKLLKFELTGAQKKVLGEIMSDLERDRPMNRLLQGDVGSGKTVVALIALLTGVDNNCQGALMAPTEILAEQHFLNIQPDCAALGIDIELITSAIPARDKTRILDGVREGKIPLVVGTHALIQKDVQFHNLGIAIIDEQHRFGVLQREALSKKGLHPHTLIMTATPIPRSLALTVYGDMDVSLLDAMPPGRKPIDTRVYYESQRDNAYAYVRQEISRGRQAYVVCPLIEETETLDLKNAIEIREFLQNLFPDWVVGLIHGRMKKEERSRIMSEFKAGSIHILTATTVIEVGIDIPNSTLMIIEHAERFGLSQLHQLRGRVGRSEHLSQCLLIAYHPLSDDAKARLKAMRETGDGFVIAEEDLKIRGPGDFMGTRQSGLPELRVANLLRDIKILDAARKEAFALIDRDPDLTDSRHGKLRQTLHRTLGDRLNLMDVI